VWLSTFISADYNSILVPLRATQFPEAPLKVASKLAVRAEVFESTVMFVVTSPQATAIRPIKNSDRLHIF
ncbi:MAG: hypothetical protein AAF449_22690, partial [Myxococcota bacterium]